MTLNSVGAKAIKDVIIATVAPQTLFNLKTLARKYFDSQPLVVGSEECDPGMEIRLDRPSEVGADRIVNARAALTKFGPNLIIVDFGTAPMRAASSLPA